MSSAATKRRATSQSAMAGSPVSDLIIKAASAADASAGVSLAFLKKALKAGGYDVDTKRARIIAALKGLVTKKDLVQVKGTGASILFKVNKDLSKPRRKKVVQRKTVEVKRVQGTRAKKAATGAAKKTAKRPKKARKLKFGRPVTRSLSSATKNGPRFLFGVL